jgi:hypothetical protein
MEQHREQKRAQQERSHDGAIDEELPETAHLGTLPLKINRRAP